MTNSEMNLLFLISEFRAAELADRDKVECFADQLARDSSVEGWQLRQAVSLYLNVYLKEVNGRNVDATPSSRSTSAKKRDEVVAPNRSSLASTISAVQGRQDAGDT